MKESATSRSSSATSRSSSATARAVAFASKYPNWVLVLNLAQLGTARCRPMFAAAKTSTERPIEVSFRVPEPRPRGKVCLPEPLIRAVCVVTCPDLDPHGNHARPCITGADGPFVVIRVIFPDRDGQQVPTDVFLYRAGPETSSLYLLPRPYPVDLHFYCVGVLSDGANEDCSVVIPERRFEADGRMSYHLQVFSTKTMSWSTKVARVAHGLEKYYGGLAEHEPTKVLNTGGGSLAWVDLRYGILICDVLGEDPEMRLIQLPQLMPINKVDFEVGADGIEPPLDSIRDVTFRNNVFRFIEIGFPDFSNSNTKFRWTATIWKRTIGSENWIECCTIDSGCISCTNSPFKLEDWERSICQDPRLDMYLDDTVYFTSRLNVDDREGWDLAVDTKNMRVKDWRRFKGRSLYFGRRYLQCSFSKYYNNISGAALKEIISEEDTLTLAKNFVPILRLQHNLMLFDNYFSEGDPCYQEFWSALYRNFQSSLPQVQTHLQYFKDYKRKVKAMRVCRKVGVGCLVQIKGEFLRNYHNEPSESTYAAVKAGINEAIVAWNNFLHVVPSVVLDMSRRMYSLWSVKHPPLISRNVTRR